jgi:hypothetical protein
MSIPAGHALCDLYPTSRSLTDLAEPFQSSVRKFLAALTARGCSFTISATYRPAERAALMHYAWRIAKEGLLPSQAPAQIGDVQIDWTVAGAEEMAAAYQLAVEPNLHSRHIDRLAIDMTIKGWPHGKQQDLYDLGAGYGVHKLVRDPPHWSSDGH